MAQAVSLHNGMQENSGVPNGVNYSARGLPNGAHNNEQERVNTLVIQITDGFLRGDETRGSHDVRPFEELLGNLLPQADVFTRCVVAQKLAHRNDLPRSIVTMLLKDENSICEPLVFHSRLLTEDDITTLMAKHDPVLRSALLARDDLSLVQRQALILNIPAKAVTPQKDVVTPMQDLLAKIKPLMVAAPASEEESDDSAPRYIELPQLRAVAPANFVMPAAATSPSAPIIIDIPLQAHQAMTQDNLVVLDDQAELIQMFEPSKTARHATRLVPQIVRAAVLRQNDELAKIIADELNLSEIITKALLKDMTGEALITACSHINLPEDASIQVATLLYPNLTRTRERITNLRTLFRQLTLDTTTRIVDAWRVLAANVKPVHETVNAKVEKQAPQSRIEMQKKQISSDTSSVHAR